MKLLRKSAPNPFLLFVLAFTAGTLWLIGPVVRKPPVISFNSPHPQAAVTPAMARALPPSPALPPQAKPDVAKLRAELDAAQQSVLAQLSELQASQADIESVQRRVEALRAELRELEAKRAALGPVRVSPSAPESDRLKLLVDQRQEEVNRLQADLDTKKTPIPQKGKEKPQLELAITPLNKLPVLVELLDNRITPVTKDYFHFPFLALKPVFDIRRTGMGETIGQAQRPDSEFARFLSKIRPKHQYLSCLLNGDSFDAFYAVRDLAMRAGVEIGWEPADTAGGKIRIVGVTLGPASSKKIVRVPDIVR